MKFKKAVPILYATDVSKSIAYFTEQLKFKNQWEWDSPSTFGGIYDGDVELFFCKRIRDTPAPGYPLWLRM